jgi:hypothetical protein
VQLEKGKKQKAFDTLKEKISSSLVLALPNLRQPFEIQTDASNYAMGEVLLQHGKPICFHFETFNGAMVSHFHINHCDPNVQYRKGWGSFKKNRGLTLCYCMRP